MNNRLDTLKGLAALVFVIVPFAGCAQVPVDEHGNEIGAYPVAVAEPAAGRYCGGAAPRSHSGERCGRVAPLPPDR